jgi:hypothetical protein
MSSALAFVSLPSKTWGAMPTEKTPGLILTTWQEELGRALGARVKEIRLAEGLSQEELSFKAEVDQSRLSKLERLGPEAIGWRGFCRVVAALGFELSFTIKKSSGIES